MNGGRKTRRKRREREEEGEGGERRALLSKKARHGKGCMLRMNRGGKERLKSRREKEGQG